VLIVGGGMGVGISLLLLNNTFDGAIPVAIILLIQSLLIAAGMYMFGKNHEGVNGLSVLLLSLGTLCMSVVLIDRGSLGAVGPIMLLLGLIFPLILIYESIFSENGYDEYIPKESSIKVDYSEDGTEIKK
jgi:hypothetical protein